MMTSLAKIHTIVAERLTSLSRRWTEIPGRRQRMYWARNGYEGAALPVFRALLEADGFVVTVEENGIVYEVTIELTREAVDADTRREVSLPWHRPPGLWAFPVNVFRLRS